MRCCQIRLDSVIFGGDSHSNLLIEDAKCGDNYTAAGWSGLSGGLYPHSGKWQWQCGQRMANCQWMVWCGQTAATEPQIMPIPQIRTQIAAPIESCWWKIGDRNWITDLLLKDRIVLSSKGSLVRFLIIGTNESVPYFLFLDLIEIFGKLYRFNQQRFTVRHWHKQLT